MPSSVLGKLPIFLASECLKIPEKLAKISLLLGLHPRPPLRELITLHLTPYIANSCCPDPDPPSGRAGGAPPDLTCQRPDFPPKVRGVAFTRS